ncbi:YoaK family protein [Anaerosporobacter sp.]|uniref:YoaK family protein n=1 Tax=Anaerosporobacter sp. TaxID=1872529 RepID=UPI00286EE633|nr:YoaK family protein [Anaerosporobacter sp.]
MNNSKQMSEKMIVGLILACVGGFLDAYTYICRGGVFANAQTGNIVLFGVRIAEGRLLGSVKYLIPIVAFVIGVFIAEIIREGYRDKDAIHWRQIIIAFEIIVILGITFIPKGGWHDTVVNVMVSFVCSLQVQTFRKFNGNAIATTMCTGNLRSAMECLYKYIHTKDRDALSSSLQYLVIILLFIIGAAVGAIMANVIGTKAIALSCIGLGSVFLLMFRKQA